MFPFKRHPQSDQLLDDENDTQIDSDLRLHTVRTAASAIAESIRAERRAETRRSILAKVFRREKRIKATDSAVSVGATSAPQVSGARRNIYVNSPLAASEVDATGEPLARYARNKVQTTSRIANLYFTALVVFQMIPVFGAATGTTAVLPILFILTVTAIKDGVEDYRRAQLDEEVNTSAVTRLGEWHNVNQARDPRPWYQRLLHINTPGKITKGVQKLRNKEAGEGRQIMLPKGMEDTTLSASTGTLGDSSVSLGKPSGGESIDSHTYPPGQHTAGTYGQHNSSLSAYQQSIPSGSSSGVIDWQRRTSGTARWERTLWKKLEVGDIVLLKENEQVPADVVVLSTSDPDGLCYLETKNLDGETNLKVRKALPATSSITSEEDIEKSSFVLDSEPPRQNLYVYNALLRFTDAASGEPRKEGVTINELLLRGCSVRNTAWVIGLVVFTGPDTKIYLNGGQTPSKQSKIAKETNFNVIMNFAFLAVLCTICSVIYGVYDGYSDTSTKIYQQGVDPTNSPALNALVTFVSCLVAFQNIVPVSLFISIEIVKTIQAFFIAQDIDMYYEPFNSACVSKNWGISDDLGQIEYIFSDKTGTLTQNVMEFQKCSINGVVYGEGVTEAQRGAATREGRADTVEPEELARKLVVFKDQMMARLKKHFKNRYMQSDKLTLVSPKFADDLVDRTDAQSGHIIAFFRALMVCHTLLADQPDPAERPYYLEYKAESPDEAALVGAARDVGFPFVGRSKDAIDVEVLGQPERYTLLKTLEFTSARKRMSVIVRTPDGRIMLYCKGADSVVYERLSSACDPVLKEKTSADMDAFANAGLRTLCVAYRVLTEEEFLLWVRTHDAATSMTENREEEMEKAASNIEQDLLLLGATALEDKLQDGVPDAIETLHRAGIKLWILTGDKLQTAIEIGYSCNLLKKDMDVMILSSDTPEGTRAQIEAGLNKIASVLGPPSLNPKNRGFVPGAQAAFAVVIDGETLGHALLPAIKPLFLSLGTQCETVVCCRQGGRDAMTLAIGDGANDVAMIQEANVGFQVPDEAVACSRRWSYQRIADMHSNFFYKNVIWTLAMFWYQPFCGFDATYLYDYSFILFYNLLFTSLPVIFLGGFDQDVNARAAMAFPELYIRGIRGLEYTKLMFWSYVLDGLYQSAVIFFIPYLVWTSGLATSWNGKGIDSLGDFGTTVAVTGVLVANIYVGMNTRYWTFMTWIVVVGSSLVMMLWIVIYSFLPASASFSSTGSFVYEVSVLFSNITVWATIVASVFISLAPRFVYKYFTTVYTPLDRDIVREMWICGDLKDRLGVKHRKASKNKQNADLETAPMFSQPHARSASEVALNMGRAYEPTVVADVPDVGDKRRGGYSSDMDAEPDALVKLGSSDLSYHSRSEISPTPLPEYSYSRPSSSAGAHPTRAPPEAFELHALQPQPPASQTWSRGFGQHELQDTSHSSSHSHSPYPGSDAPYGAPAALNTAYLPAGQGRYQPQGAVPPDTAPPWGESHAI
ncbi:phospholipid-translocating P-type ATPase [Melanogaster broomeanus]|nr:phospholipid-translocating P-type ATPase [Melanogaster broomeanus]